MALAKVEGILSKNNGTREEMLKKVYWKDKQYTDFGGGNFVEKAVITDREVSPIGEGQDLLSYTYNRDTDLGRDILKKYMSDGNNHAIYENGNVPNGDLHKWYGDYSENFDPENELYKVGVVKLSEGELRTEFANEGRFLEEKYITPELLNFYGNKIRAQLGIINNTLKGRFDGFIKVGTGRMADIAEADVKVISYDQALKDAKNGKGALGKYLLESIEEAKRQNASAKTPNDVYFANNESYEDFSQNINPFEASLTYDEHDDSGNPDEYTHYVETDDGNSTKFVTPDDLKEKSLLTKTAQLFNSHKIATMIGRFHTTLSDNGVDSEPTFIDSAVRGGLGNSHGRNLLTKSEIRDKSKNIGNGYENPYCRVWTYHHQYDKFSKTIRPFKDINKDARSFNPYVAVATDNLTYEYKGSDYLKENTVLGRNGLVNIAPKSNGNCTSTTEIKKCMFSIENLAWKDVPRKGSAAGEYYISDEQRGPNGGRIMWFPPYDLDYQENVNVSWAENHFIGRGEPVFTYSNTNRTGTLTFVILVDHPSIIDNIPKRNLSNDQLAEEDILRFFAGCDVPDGFIKDGADCGSEPKVEENKKKTDEPDNIPNPEKGKHIKFYVYFPNNYSGNAVVTRKKDWDVNGSSDRLWYNYLLFGKNEIVPENAEEGVGYEIRKTDNTGVTETTYTGGSYVAETNEIWTEGKGVVKDVNYRYRVDFDLHQKLWNVTKNKQSRKMEYSESNYIDSASFGLNNSIPKSDATNSFTEILASMVKAGGEFFSVYTTNNIGTISSGSTELIDLFKNAKARITKIELVGGATGQDDPHSQELARRRCRSIKDLLTKFVDNSDIFSERIEVGDKLEDSTTINTKAAKMQRYASCEIWFDGPKIDTVSVKSDTDKLATGATETANEQARRVLLGTNSGTRYETESEYFRNIDREDPLIHKKLVEKFKYFNPAFHSISPEGFNARLTFLQQCTRQGHTISASERNGFAKTAGNLSFGRMPVCVLRLGDFLNTKILINGMSIAYGGNGAMQWDLNPEGIGVQPMYAKVSLQITVIGGQSLEGPINRLQNAVSFNYYANTGVYDNRSDRISIVKDIQTADGTDNGQVVRVNREDGYSVIDNSEYDLTKTVYKHVFTPAPDIKIAKN